MVERDDHYRRLCDNPTQYDKVIDWIRDNNPAAHTRTDIGTPEQFACYVVHDCIRQVLFGNAGGWSATGRCIALRVNSNPELPGYKKVILAIQL